MAASRVSSSVASLKRILRSHYWIAGLRLSPSHGQQRMVASATRLPAQPRTFPTSGFPLLPTHVKFEAERLPSYRADKSFPVRLGDVVHSSYQVVAKPGFGTASTVWLCRDLQLSQLFDIKTYWHTDKPQENKL